MGFCFYFPFIFIIISLIGKFGLFPASFGIMGLVDGISLFSIIVLLVLNKYIQLILLLYFIKPLYYDIASLLIILSGITIYHSISLILKGFTLRKFIAVSSMITFAVLLIYLIYTQLGLFYLLLYFALCFSLFAIIKVDLSFFISQFYLRILIIGAIFSLGYISFIIFFNKFDILFYTLILNGLSVVIFYIISLACNYSYF